MRSPPTGTVTFLFTDVEGSSRLWEEQPAAMREALVEHDRLIERLAEEYQGRIVRPRGEGDSRFCVFARATDAVAAAVAMQRALHAVPWATACPLRVRMALHTGEADLRDGDYYGSAVNRCARIRSLAYGGQTLVSEVTAALVRESLPEGTLLRDLGQYRLKDLTAPERVHSLVVAGLPADFPLLGSVDAVPNNLPIQLSSFVGREAEVGALLELLRRPGIRLLTLTGPGGTGKTRLALQAAAEALGKFPDGVFVVVLDSLPAGAAVASAIARTLGAREAPGQTPVEAVAELVRRRRMLLVLDNFEHVVDAAPDVAALLALCTGLKALATSRVALRVYGGHELPVPPLAIEPDGIRLFAERARALEPNFVLTAENAPTVAEICRRVDGLPLAIELAAARTRLFPPKELLARLDQRMLLLTGGGIDRPERQRTMRSAIAWSHDLLSEAGRVLFRRLAVFAGSCDFEAAEAVCNPDGALDLLGGIESLVSSSLLQRRDVGGEARFAMLRVVHEYALDRLDATGEAEELRERHGDYFLELAERSELDRAGRLHGPWFVRLDADLDNLHLALDRLIRRGARARALRLGVALSEYWNNRGLLAEGRERLAAACAQRGSAAADVASETLEAQALEAQGLMAANQVDLVAAQHLLTEALARWRALGDLNRQARALRFLSFAHQQGGEYDPAQRFLDEGLALARQIGDEAELVDWLYRQADHAGDRGERETQRRCAEEALALARRLGDRQRVGRTLTQLGMAAFFQGRTPEARRALVEAAEIFPADGPIRLPTVHLVHRHLGHAALAEGDWAEGLSRFEAMLRWALEQKLSFGVAYSLDDLAVLAVARGQPARALRLAAAAAAIRDRHRAPRSPGWLAYLEGWLVRVRRQVAMEVAETAAAEGQAMTLEEVIDYALGESD